MQLRDAEGWYHFRRFGESGLDLARSETLSTWQRPLYGTWEISSAPGAARRDGS